MNCSKEKELFETNYMCLLSIVIPTRNRPELLMFAINSLLDQSNQDFEIIVSDNSSEDLSLVNKKNIALLNNPRIVYVRPPSPMAMVDHWNWAIEKAKGFYISILTDRMVFKKEAISFLYNILNFKKPKLLVFSHDKLSGDVAPFTYIKKTGTGDYLKIESTKVFELCCKGIVSRYWPRMLNSVCQKDVLNQIRTNYGEVFSGVAPDYSFCFRALDWLGEYYYIDESLIISAGHKFSNGKIFLTNSRHAVRSDFISLSNSKLSDSDRDVFENSFINWMEPVPYNIEMLEYLLAKKYQKSGNLKDIEFKSFYVNSKLRVLRSKYQGYSVEQAEISLNEFREKFRLRFSILENMKLFFIEKFFYLRSFVKIRTGVYFSLRFKSLDTNIQFSSVLDAREFDFLSSKKQLK